MNAWAKADLAASRMGAERVVFGLQLAGCEPREVGRTVAGRSWRARCPRPACRHEDLVVDETVVGVRVRCRGLCGSQDPRWPVFYLTLVLRSVPESVLQRIDRRAA